MNGGTIGWRSGRTCLAAHCWCVIGAGSGHRAESGLIPMPTRALPSTHWLELFASNAGEAIAPGNAIKCKSGSAASGEDASAIADHFDYLPIGSA